MSKLQLYITISLNGYRNMTDINGDEDVRNHVIDIREAVDEISYDPKDKNFFYLLKYTDTGVFVVVIRTIPENPSDYLASWIFIPSDIAIADREIEDVVNSVIRVVTNTKITSEDLAGLRKIFSKSYPEKEDPGATVANHGKRYAHRFYGGDTGYLLSDYIGSKRYQTSYLQYAGVILADKSIATRVGGPNITDEPLDQMVRIFPPLADDRPYRPMIFDRPFTHPFLVPLMGTVEIVWESSTSVDIRQSIMINKADMRPDNISLQSTRPGVARQPENTQTAEPAETPHTSGPATVISLGGKTGAQRDEDTMPSALPTKPKVRQAETSVVNEPTVDNASARPADNDTRTISYNRDRLYRFEIPAKSADISGMIHFEIHTRNQLTGSPIDGYELTEAIQEGATRSNHLVYSPTENIQTKGIWGLIGFVVGILLTCLCTCIFSGGSDAEEEEYVDEADTTTVLIERPSDTPESVKVETETKKEEAAPEEKKSASLDDAIKYLDKNSKWTKADLDKYPDLAGLYEDMNSLNRQRLVDYWGPKLSESRSFSNIVKHCSLAIKGKKEPKPRSGGSTFNKEGDTTIPVRSYLNTIDP